MIEIPQKIIVRFWSLGSFLAFLAIISFLLPQHIVAQTIEREPLPEPLPRLPSVSEYSLPPGEDSSSDEIRAEGPVEENARPPAPVTSAETEDQPTTAPSVDTPPVNIQPQPEVAAPRNTANPQPQFNRPNTNQPAPAPPRPNIANPRETPAQLPVPGQNEPAPGFSFDRPDTNNQELAETPESRTEDPDISPTESPDSGFDSLLLFGVPGLTLMLLVIGLTIWKKRNFVAKPTREELPRQSPAEPQTTPRKVAPKIFSPPDPVHEPEAPHPDADGFVTTKLGTPQKTKSPTPNVQNFSSARPRRWNHLDLEFAVESAASTLMNAVVRYTVVLTNKSGETVSGLDLSGALMQANATSANEQATKVPILHQVAALEPGESTTWSGEIRLPLNAIKPIRVKTRALFIPMARFSIRYRDQDDVAHEQNAAFVIGQEHEPPRPKMAPFRLDLGPRTFTPIGHRPLMSNR